MHISSAHKERLGKIARVATAGAMVVSSLSLAVASPVSAVALEDVSVTINNSRPSISTGVNYLVSFTPTVSTTQIHTVQVEFCTTANTFGTACTAPTGFSVDNGTVNASSVAAGFGTGTGNAGTFSAPSANVVQYVTGASNVETSIAHTLNIVGATTNPSVVGTYYARIRTYSDAGSTAIDDGTAAFAILNSVVVTGRVLESMTFTVNQVNTATQCGAGVADTSNVTTTDVAIPFGNYASGTPRVGCQIVATATNAIDGYSTRIQQYTGGTSPVGAMCRQTAANCTNDGGQSGVSASDAIVNASLTNTAATWTNSTTFGLGVNANGGQRHSAFSAAENVYRGLYNGSSVGEQVTLASSSAPTAATNTYVVFKSDVPAQQTAGVYQNRLIYITTPQF